MDRLGGEPAVCLEDVVGRDAREAKRGPELLAERERQVGEVGEAAHVRPMHAGQELLGAVRGLAAGGEPRGERFAVNLADRRAQPDDGEISHDDP